MASRDVAVLISGETGTGKEIIARAIYQHSDRRDQIFHAINCAAIPEPLLESELFGHEKGAFTGAESRRIGKFETCNGGTLFLDEIGDMSLIMQTKLLRVLQQKEFERVGGNETLKSDVRIIAATNRDLKAAMEDKSFRSDLFYRLNEFPIELPPLRDRGDDLPLLIEHLFREFARTLPIEFATVEPATMRALMAYRWPGNVRELQGVIKQTLLRASGPVITPDFLPIEISGSARPAQSTAAVNGWQTELQNQISQQLDDGALGIFQLIHDLVDRVLLATVLDATNGNLSEASNRLGISRPTLRSRIKHLNLPRRSDS